MLVTRAEECRAEFFTPVGLAWPRSGNLDIDSDQVPTVAR